ncbi:MAG: P-loop NTPase [Deltaproteobacteria bacterium]|nr:P-loop NTPase [Deltaproteobacteria bacterium]MBW1746954.1 P-loop NTPase [Deltaproteobacteria bacterium]MBW1825525.1 P-loop NTPase [Deltaproteobacteria bacterium]MBW1969086.1 P-loop NTPase [Deltaproteobacteria bacterium]MBW2156853.1 P-loop NTPase [Deltaproteobacteria bacterium]
MKELVVISGKGGTGKTSLMAAFASLAENKVLCDADVDAADLHLLMDPDIKESHDFQGGGIAIINPNNCTQCGLCRDLCRWNAISEAFEVDPIECEGCGVCVDFCPEEAIDFPIKTCGEWFISNTRFGPMVHARLGIAEENSGKLVALVRQEAKKLAEKNELDLIITDGPPGVGCPVIASVGGASAVLVVAEPTVSGLHDMERVAQLAAHFKVPGMVCVNKFDLNFDQTEAIEKLAKENNMTVVGRVPFDPVFTKSMVQGQTVLEYVGNSKIRSSISEIWRNIRNQLVF